MSSVDKVRVGVLGGGQLGRMMGYAAHRLGLHLTTLDAKGSESPAGLVAQAAVTGAFTDAVAIGELASRCDVVTVEIEHVNVDALMDLEAAAKVLVRPSVACLTVIRDKLAQKEAMAAAELPTVDFRSAATVDDVVEAAREWDGFPLMLKTRFQGYDGRGNAVVNRAEDVDAAFKALGGDKLYVERWARFRCEIAVMVARSVRGEVAVYPVVETRQRDSVCEMVVVPPTMPVPAEKAQRIAVAAVERIDGVGVFGVEMFVMDDGRVLVNELAPRPHNSGHYTIEACVTDQFEQHLRAIAGLPLGDTSLRVPAAAMLNLFGGDNLHERLGEALKVPGCGVHWYGKEGNRSGRKMAHLTITGANHLELGERLAQVGYSSLKSGRLASADADVAVVMGSDSDLPTMAGACDALRDMGISFEVSVVSAHRTPQRMVEFARSARERGLKVIIAGAGGAAHLPGMVAAMTTLPVIGVPVKTSALSGVDSLYSIVQMPRGVPVATVAIGNAVNAGLLAARMIGSHEPAIAARMELYLEQQRVQVHSKAALLEEMGDVEYLRRFRSSKE